MISESRIEFRVSSEEKAIIEAAAEITGQKLSAFARSVLLTNARKLKAEFDVVEMSSRDAERIMRALDKPFEPTRRMAKALETVEAMNR